jgi:hypothetical protein
MILIEALDERAHRFGKLTKIMDIQMIDLLVLGSVLVLGEVDGSSMKGKEFDFKSL